MPTEQELQNEVDKLKRERDSKRRIYESAQKAANYAAQDLKEGQAKYQKSLNDAKKQSQEALNKIAQISS